IVTINKITPVYVSFSVPEGQLPALKRFIAAQGTLPASAIAPTDSGSPSTGRINFIDNAVDPTTGTIKVKGTFPNDDRRLWPGQFVNVTVTLTSDPNAIVVPSPAVQTGQQGTFVFIVQPDQTVELRPVTVARLAGDETVLQTGVSRGDTVVTEGYLRLLPGSRSSVMIARAQRQLHPQMPAPPSFQKVIPGDQPVMMLVLRSSTMPMATLEEYAETTMAQRISMVSGVAQVQVYGAAKYAVRVDVDPKKLAAHGIGIDEVATAIANANVNLPTGTMYGDKTFVVQTNGQLMKAQAYAPMIIAYRNGNPVRLDDVSRVFDGIEDDKQT